MTTIDAQQLDRAFSAGVPLSGDAKAMDSARWRGCARRVSVTAVPVPVAPIARVAPTLLSVHVLLTRLLRARRTCCAMI